ncbi:RNA-directed DNA polymerase, eukaryota [Tanacetum coccineum]
MKKSKRLFGIAALTNILVPMGIHLNSSRMQFLFYCSHSEDSRCQKSKLMGLGVLSNVVNSAANLMGCFILQLPFNYLGVKVGCNMSYIGSWEDVISKVPMGVLKKPESIRMNFFNGHDGFARKSSWFNWNKALASKKNGVKPNRRSIWSDILQAVNSLKDKVRGLVLLNIEDRWSWSLEGYGLFSIKSSSAYIDDLLLPKADAATRWIRILPIKINVFAWKVCLDALPTRCNMSLREIDIPSILCPLCNRAVENSDHILFSCSMVQKVWRRLLTWWELDVSSFHSYNEWISWLSSIRLPKLLKVFLEGSCYVMWWLVWKFRNRLLFSDPTSKPDSLFDDVVQMSFLWMNSRSKSRLNWISWLKSPMCISM